MTKLLANCLDAKYLEEEELLLVFVQLPEMGVKRVLPLPRSDCVYKGNKCVPHEEMHRTAEMWKGKPFFLGIVDEDADTDTDVPSSMFEKEKVMLGDVGTQMLDFAEKMTTDEWIMQFKQAELFQRLAKRRG